MKRGAIVGLLVPVVAACQALLVFDPPETNRSGAGDEGGRDEGGRDDGGLVGEASSADSSADGSQGPETAWSCPPPAASIACDTFDRADQTNGWGLATSGSIWAVAPSSATHFSIVARTGELDALLPQWQVARLGFDVDAVEVFVVFRLTGQDGQFGAILRENLDAYYAAVFRNAGSLSIQTFKLGVPNVDFGGVPVPGGPNPTPTSAYALRFRAKGNSLMAKVWRNSDPEPGAWMTSATDSLLATGQSGIVAVNGHVSVEYFQSTRVP